MKAVRYALFWVVFLGLMWGASLLVYPKENTTEAGMEGRDIPAAGVKAEPEDSLDVIIVGDSESQAGISPMELWQNHGITSYVCGQSGQRAAEAYYMLKEVLKRQSPKLVILETDLFYHFHDKDTERKYSLEKAAQYYFPVFKYHNRWKSLTERDWNLEWGAAERNPFKGFLVNYESKPYTKGEYMRKTDEREAIIQAVTAWADRTLALCRAKKIPLLLVGMPAPKNWDYKRHNGVNAYAAKRGIPYLDLNLPDSGLQMDWSKDSRDEGDHLNTHGAIKVSRYLGKYLKDRYALPDHRGDKRYGYWEKDLARYRQTVKETDEQVVVRLPDMPSEIFRFDSETIQNNRI